MSITITLDPETEAKLQRQADAAGRALEEHIAQLARAEAAKQVAIPPDEPDVHPHDYGQPGDPFPDKPDNPTWKMLRRAWGSGNGEMSTEEAMAMTRDMDDPCRRD